MAFSDERFHGKADFISPEIVARFAMQSVISEAHVPGNDGIKKIPPPVGGGKEASGGGTP